MATENLQDKIDLVIFKDNENKLMCEVYFKGNLECWRGDCGELLGTLLNFKVISKTIKANDNREQYTDETVVIIDKSNLLEERNNFESNINNIKKNINLYDNLSLNNVLYECLLNETFDCYDTYTSLNFRHYYELCSENGIKINFDTFEKFLCSYRIQNKYSREIIISKDYDYKTSPGILVEEYIYSDSYSSEETFLETVSKKTNYRTAYYYEDCQYTDFLFILTYHLLRNDVKIKKCERCKKYFAQTTPNQKYCDRKILIKNGENIDVVSCSELAIREQRKNRDSKKLYIKLENNVRTMLSNRTKAKTISKEEKNSRNKIYFDFLEQKEIYLERLNKGEITEDIYISWLNTFRNGKGSADNGNNTKEE